MSAGDPTNFPLPGAFVSSGQVMVSNGFGQATWVNTREPIVEIQNRLDAIERRLAILKPNEALQAKYPALQEAYDNYRLIEKLVEGQTGNDT